MSAIHWRAGDDGVAHAFGSRGRNARTLCDRSGWEERYDHPPRLRCLACAREAGEVRR